MITHKEAARIHAKKRLKERYGNDGDKDTYKRITELINNKKIIKETFLSWSRRQVWVYLDKTFYKAIYDHKLKTVVTFLPTNNHLD